MNVTSVVSISSRWRVVAVAVWICVLILSGCAGPDASEEASERVEADRGLIDALEVEVLGTFTPAEQEVVDWALQRFSEGGFQLPQKLVIAFDPTRVLCDNALGCCLEPAAKVPTVYVCEDASRTAAGILDQRVALLHELAHIWHANMVGTGAFDDLESVVGGVMGLAESTPWEDRSEERLAVVISWGLLDQIRRPVGANVTCSELYRQFVEVTGNPPLGPLGANCIPPPGE